MPGPRAVGSQEIFFQWRPSAERQVPPVAQQPPAPNAMRPSVTVSAPASNDMPCLWQAVHMG
ncbi:hypothetical protein D3C71_1752440 [compost metagenome]